MTNENVPILLSLPLAAQDNLGELFPKIEPSICSPEIRESLDKVFFYIRRDKGVLSKDAATPDTLSAMEEASLACYDKLYPGRDITQLSHRELEEALCSCMYPAL